MHSFRGKATIFGSTDNCNDKAECEFSEILQFDGDTNSWLSIGRMTESKTLMDVLEVPQSFCSILNTFEPSSSTESSSGDSTTTAGDDMTSTVDAGSETSGSTQSGPDATTDPGENSTEGGANAVQVSWLFVTIILMLNFRTIGFEDI